MKLQRFDVVHFVSVVTNSAKIYNVFIGLTKEHKIERQAPNTGDVKKVYEFQTPVASSLKRYSPP